MLLERAGFQRGIGCGVVFWHTHTRRDIGLANDGGDFTFCSIDEGLEWIKHQMKSWFNVETRNQLAGGDNDDQEVTILRQTVNGPTTV